MSSIPTIYPVYHQYRNYDNLYVVKIKNTDSLVLKVFNESQERVFTNTIFSKDRKFPQVRQIFRNPLEKIDFPALLESLVEARFLRREFISQKSSEEEITNQWGSGLFGQIGSFLEGTINVIQEAGKISERLEIEKAITVFGSREWETLIGGVGEEPPLPRGLLDILSSRCPYHMEESVADTHMLLLIPKTIDNKMFTIKTLTLIIKKSFSNFGMQNPLYEVDLGKFENKTIQKPYWILITKDIIPQSQSKSYAQQKQNLDIGYESPTALELYTGIVTHYAKNRYYACSENILFRCQEKVGDGKRVAIGISEPTGIRFSSCHDNYRNKHIGAIGLRKFY